MRQTDEELMISYQEGDENAFQELYNRYSKRVYGYLNKRLNSDFDVDEVFQSIFMKLHKSRGQYDSTYKFAPWLFTICRTIIIDSARTKKIWNESKFEPIEDDMLPVQIGAADRETVNLTGVPKHQKEVLEMRYLEEMSFEEIAQQLNSNPTTVRKRVSRAIHLLREQWRKS